MQLTLTPSVSLTTTVLFSVKEIDSNNLLYNCAEESELLEYLDTNMDNSKEIVVEEKRVETKIFKGNRVDVAIGLALNEILKRGPTMEKVLRAKTRKEEA